MGDVGVEDEVGVEVEVGLVGWLGGWMEIWRVKLISTQVSVSVEVVVELGNTKLFDMYCVYSTQLVFDNKEISTIHLKLNFFKCKICQIFFEFHRKSGGLIHGSQEAEGEKTPWI